MDLLIKYILIVEILFSKSVLSSFVKSNLKFDVKPLTLNFFANLEQTLKDEPLNDYTKQLIEQQVSNYVSVVKHVYGTQVSSKSRRSVTDDNKKNSIKDENAGYIFQQFVKRYDLKIEYLKDVVLFTCDYEKKEALYMGVLINVKNGPSNFIIYKLHNHTFLEITRIADVQDNTKMTIYNSNGSVFVVLTGSDDNRANYDNKNGVFKFEEEVLNKIQSLKSTNATDITLWEQNEDLFMIISEASSNENRKTDYEVNIPIYKWLEKHFDIIDHIKTYNGQKITQFNIESSHFLVVANFQNNYGNTQIYSEIFKYNLHLDKFETYQKILTNGAVDVKYFEYVNQNVRESFLIFASLCETDLDGSLHYETDSIVYRYVDYYFIPFQSFTLNGATQWLPLNGENGELLLLVASKFEGLKSFQYNGWLFTEIHYTEMEYFDGFTTMSSFTFGNETFAVLFNDNSGGIFKPIFELDTFERDMLSWCEQTLMDLEPVKKLPKRDTLQQEVENLSLELNFYAQELKQIEDQVSITLHSTNENRFEGDVFVENIIFNNAQQSFEFITSDMLNEFNVSDMLNNLLDVTRGFESDSILFTNININNNFSPSFINGHSIKLLENPNELVLSGSATFDKGVFLDGSLNGIRFREDDVLLKTKDQTIPNFNLKDLKAKNVTVQKMNGLSMSQSNKGFTSVVAKRINLDGLLNSANLTELNQNVLRNFGNQTLTAPYHFDHLHVSNLNVKKFSKQNIPEDLISVESGTYNFPNNVQFVHFNTEKLIIHQQLNSIRIINGTPNFLLVNSEKPQHVKDQKVFENVHLMNHYDARGRVHSAQLDQYQPVTLIHQDNLVLTGDYFINGNVTIEKKVKVNNLFGSQPNFSVRRLKEQGIKLNSSSIPVHLKFLQPLDVQEVFVDTINDVDTRSLIVMGFEQTQVVTGWKKFLHDVTITGPTEVIFVNGINMPDLDVGVLKVVGDQTIVGEHHFKNIIANRVYNIKTKFNNNLWENVMTKYGNQNINGTTIITKSARANQLSTNSILTKSFVNDLNFDEIVKDTIFAQTQKPIENLEFNYLIVENLTVKSYNKDHLNVSPDNVNFEIDESVSFPSDIFVRNITFLKEFNGIPSENFGHLLLDLEDQVIFSEQTFDKIVVLGNMFVETGTINGINFGNFVANSIKIDEEFHFKGATFPHGLESFGVTLDGLFESLDLEDVVQSYIPTEQVINDHVLFKNDVRVLGHTNFQGLVSNYNLSKLCNFAFDTSSTQTKNLHINGSIIFRKGPEVHYINNRLLSSILDNAWFTNKDAKISGFMQFNTLNFTNHLTVGGYLDNVKTQLIAPTYLSKSSNQTISATLEFDEYAIFSKGIQAKRAFVAGEVAGISLSEFMQTAILNGSDQLFETIVVADVVEIHDLAGNYLVNGLNLENDVMRYDQYNMVTGKKTIRDVQTRKLVTDNPVNVQNVDIISWLKSCVLTSGSFKIAGKVKFLNQTDFIGELNSKCPLNGIKFDEDNILTKSTHQVVTGKKTFNNPVTFESLNIKEDLNGINISKLLALQAHQDADLIINSPIKLQGELTTSNLNLEKLYQGVNVSQLISNITELDVAENYYERYDKLLNVSNLMVKTLEGQAYYLDYFEVRRDYKFMDYIFPIKLADANLQYLACFVKNDDNYFIQFQNLEDFTYDGIENVEMDKQLMYAQNIPYKGKHCWYAENKLAQSGNVLESYQGEIFEMTSSGILSVMAPLLHNGTRAVASLTLPDSGDDCLVALFETQAVLYCENRGNGFLDPLLIMPTTNGKKIITTAIQEIPYIFILNQGTFSDPPSVVIWKYILAKRQFLQIQIIPIAYANDLTTITYQQSTYLAISSDDNGPKSELVDVRKFDLKTNQFETIQTIITTAPTKMELVELPTNELVLYIICDNPRAPLEVYMYEGVGGFKIRNVPLEFPTSQSMTLQTFTTEDNDHFVLVHTDSITLLVEGIFKGQKFT